MSRYIKLFGKKAKKAIENKIDSKTKNKVLKSFLYFLQKEKKKYYNKIRRILNLLKRNSSNQI